MPFKPGINRTVIIGVRQQRLCEAPTTVLAALDRYLEHPFTLCNDEVIFRLVRSVLYGHIEPAPSKLRGGNCFRGNAICQEVSLFFINLSIFHLPALTKRCVGVAEGLAVEAGSNTSARPLFKRLTSSNVSNTSVRNSPSFNASTDECSYQGRPLDALPFRAKRTIRLIMGDWRQVPYLARRSALTRLLFQPRQVERDEPEGETASEQDCADPALVIVLEP